MEDEKVVRALTDLGNSERFLEKHCNDVKFCKQLKKWFIYNQGLWVMDANSILYEKAKITVRSIVSEAGLADEELKKSIIEHAKKSESLSRIKAMIKLAEMAPEIQIHLNDLDANPMLLHCRNGVVDLLTGKLMPHDRKYLITKTAGITHDEESACPLWLNFIKKIMNNDEEMVKYLQKIFGYALTASTVEQVIFLLVGMGCNGKSTLLERIRRVMGDYAKNSPAQSLLVSQSSNIRSDIARLTGARLVTAVEIGDDKRLDEALVKQITGGDPVTSRFLYKDFFEHSPTYKIFIAANYNPDIRGIDHGIWRRIRVIPFSVIIPDSEIDKDFGQKLDDELSGILKWCIEGCLLWKQEGLGLPEAVTEAIDNYRKTSDVIGQFLEDCFIINSELQTSVKDLNLLYERWSKDNGQDPIKKRTIGLQMKIKGFIPSKSGSVRYWDGLGIKEPDKTDEKKEKIIESAVIDSPAIH